MPRSRGMSSRTGQLWSGRRGQQRAMHRSASFSTRRALTPQQRWTHAVQALAKEVAQATACVELRLFVEVNVRRCNSPAEAAAFAKGAGEFTLAEELFDLGGHRYRSLQTQQLSCALVKVQK